MRDISASVSFPRQFIVRIAFVFLLLLAVGIFSPSGVRADNFAVSTPAELSAAINNANNEGTYPGLDVITLTAATFTVSAVSYTHLDVYKRQMRAMVEHSHTIWLMNCTSLP